MQIIGLDEAVRMILERIRDCRQEEEAEPFFLIVGAGISCPEVPLAGGVIDECQERLGPVADGLEPGDEDAYDFWFHKAFPDAGGGDVGIWRRSAATSRSPSRTAGSPTSWPMARSASLTSS